MGGETSGGVRSSSAGRPLVSTAGRRPAIVPMRHAPPRRLSAQPAGILLRVSETVPSRRGRGLRALALVLNALLFAIGVFFELHPRDRHDVWSAAGVAGVAILNSAALTMPPGGPVGRHLVARLRRIAYLASGLLLLTGVAIVALELLLDWQLALLHGVALVLPPLVTAAALREIRGD
jgi:hypothetical protein